MTAWFILLVARDLWTCLLVAHGRRRRRRTRRTRRRKRREERGEEGGGEREERREMKKKKEVMFYLKRKSFSSKPCFWPDVIIIPKDHRPERGCWFIPSWHKIWYSLGIFQTRNECKSSSSNVKLHTTNPIWYGSQTGLASAWTSICTSMLCGWVGSAHKIPHTNC